MSMSGHALAMLAEVRDRMMAEDAAAVRSEMAQQLGEVFSSGDLDAPERQIALAIFGKLAQDVAQQVRASLASHIASCPLVPAELARTIASDTDAVAIPFISASPALPEDDLLAIISTGNTAKQIAIADRETVSEAVSHALLETRNIDVVTTVLRNDGAAIGDESYREVMDHFAADNMVQSLLIERPALPLDATERLIQSVSDVLRERLIEKHNVAPELAMALVDQAGEQTLARDAAALPNTFDVEMLAARLHGSGKLTPTLLMRALTMGDLRFFEVGIAILASIPPDNATALIADDGPDGFRALYERAGLPEGYFKAFRTALDVQRNVAASGRQQPNPDPVGEILARIKREYENAHPPDLEHLMNQMANRAQAGTRH